MPLFVAIYRGILAPAAHRPLGLSTTISDKSIAESVIISAKGDRKVR